jgi:hypothetical protein
MWPVICILLPQSINYIKVRLLVGAFDASVTGRHDRVSEVRAGRQSLENIQNGGIVLHFRGEGVPLVSALMADKMTAACVSERRAGECQKIEIGLQANARVGGFRIWELREKTIFGALVISYCRNL